MNLTPESQISWPVTKRLMDRYRSVAGLGTTDVRVTYYHPDVSH